MLFLLCVCVYHSECVLELSIMPKDEDVLQLVSARNFYYICYSNSVGN